METQSRYKYFYSAINVETDESRFDSVYRNEVEDFIKLIYSRDGVLLKITESPVTSRTKVSV